MKVEVEAYYGDIKVPHRASKRDGLSPVEYAREKAFEKLGLGGQGLEVRGEKGDLGLAMSALPELAHLQPFEDRLQALLDSFCLQSGGEMGLFRAGDSSDNPVLYKPRNRMNHNELFQRIFDWKDLGPMHIGDGSKIMMDDTATLGDGEHAYVQNGYFIDPFGREKSLPYQLKYNADNTLSAKTIFYEVVSNVYRAFERSRQVLNKGEVVIPYPGFPADTQVESYTEDEIVLFAACLARTNLKFNPNLISHQPTFF